MSGIEEAINEASLVEAQLTVYDEALGRIREAMERVGQKNNAIHIANRNARLLLEQLEVVIVSILLFICTNLINLLINKTKCYFFILDTPNYFSRTSKDIE